MINSRIFLSAMLLCATASLLLISSALPNPLVFSPETAGEPSKLRCDVTVKQIGKLSLEDGILSVRGNSVEVRARSAYEPASLILHGIILQVETNLDTVPRQVTGLAYFNGGELIKDIDDPEAKDILFRHDGALSGKILGISGYDLSVATITGGVAKINTSTVKFVRSPRAFLFQIPLEHMDSALDAIPLTAQAQEAIFKPTARERTLPPNSILPARPPLQPSAGLSEPPEYNTLKDLDEEDPRLPVFKWIMPGMPGQPSSFGQRNQGGI